MDAKNRKENLFSIIIISYNQEKYIEDAVLGAFNQDFDNYEIIISDDCSTDNTWEIINKTVGKEKIKKNVFTVLNRNEKNLGIVRNYQKALSLTKGNWIVGMAGDDISKSNRLKVINELVTTNKDIYAVGTGFDFINASGKYIYKNIPCILNEIRLPLYPGFSAAVHRDTFTKFPNITENIQSEDIIYTLRALELGAIILTNTSTVKYRIHTQNVSSKGTTIKAYEGKIKNNQNAIKTLEYYKLHEIKNKNLISVIDSQIKSFRENIEHYKFIVTFYRMNFWRKLVNLSKIKPPQRNEKYYIYFYRLKVFSEFYGDFSNPEKIFKKIFRRLNSLTNGSFKPINPAIKIKSYKVN